MRFNLNVQFFGIVNMRMRFILNLLVLETQLVNIFRILQLKGVVGAILYICNVLHLLEKGEGILHLGRKMMKVLRSNGVSGEELLDDIFN